MKQALVRLLANASSVAELRANQTKAIPNEFRFLCAGPDFVGANRSQRVAVLSAQLRFAVASANASALRNYRARSRNAALNEWSASERVAHFIDALALAPDSVHSIDRLAVALADHAAPPRAAAARALLLHWAVLRGLIDHPEQRPAQHFVRGLTARPFWSGAVAAATTTATARDFPWLAMLLRPESIAAMRRELVQLQRQGRLRTVEQEEGLHLGAGWSELHLQSSGAQEPDAHERAPLTTRLLRRSGGDFINARFSVLRAGTHVTPHAGLSNAKLRVHIALIVGDDGACGVSDGIRVGGARGETRRWVEGEAIIFDDSFEHEVRWRAPPDESPLIECSSSPAPSEWGDARAVLIIDVFHPDATEAQRVRMRSTFGAGRGQPALPRRGERVRSAQRIQAGPASNSIEFGARGVVVGTSPLDANKLAVRFAADAIDGAGGSDAALSSPTSLYPDQIVTETLWQTLLPGGFRRGDAVHRFKEGDRGVVIGESFIDGASSASTSAAGDSVSDSARRLAVAVDGGDVTVALSPSAILRAVEFAALAQDAMRMFDGEATTATATATSSSPPTMDVDVLSQDPLLVRVGNFVTEDEIHEIMRIGTPRLAASRVESEDGAGGVSPQRTSVTAFIDGEDAFSPLLTGLQKRLAAFTGLDWRHSENVQLVKYEAGDFFKPHWDFFKPKPGAKRRPGGQRMFSCFVYLNGDAAFDGGNTVFPALNITVRPKKGSALIWRNVDYSVPPRPDFRTLHEGREVTRGTKFALNVWVVEEPFETYRAAERYVTKKKKIAFSR